MSQEFFGNDAVFEGEVQPPARSERLRWCQAQARRALRAEHDALVRLLAPMIWGNSEDSDEEKVRKFLRYLEERRMRRRNISTKRNMKQ